MSTIPYCYLIGWSDLGFFYYGRRTAKNCHPSDLWSKYFTSSEAVKNFHRKYGDPDIIQIRKTFKSDEADKCFKWESKVLNTLNVRNRNDFLNKTNGDENFSFIMSGPCSEQRRNSIKESRKNTKKILCKHCDRKIDPGNYRQFHGDKCKQNPDIDEFILEERSQKARNNVQKSIKNKTHSHPSPTSFGNLICPHCNKKGKNIGSMKRFHYDNCSKFTGIKHSPVQLQKCCCVKCKKEYDIGNFTKHLSQCHLT